MAGAGEFGMHQRDQVVDHRHEEAAALLHRRDPRRPVERAVGDQQEGLGAGALQHLAERAAAEGQRESRPPGQGRRGAAAILPSLIQRPHQIQHDRPRQGREAEQGQLGDKGRSCIGIGGEAPRIGKLDPVDAGRRGAMRDRQQPGDVENDLHQTPAAPSEDQTGSAPRAPYGRFSTVSTRKVQSL